MRADTLLQVARLVLKPGIALRATTIAQLGRFRTPNVAVLADHRIVERGLYWSSQDSVDTQISIAVSPPRTARD